MEKYLLHFIVKINNLQKEILEWSTKIRFRNQSFDHLQFTVTHKNIVKLVFFFETILTILFYSSA